MHEKRRRTRVPFHATADIQVTGARLTDLTTRDLSHKGMSVDGPTPLEIGQGCYVTVYLRNEGESPLELRMEGKVARVGAEGAGIDFISMDPETYLHLRNLVILNAEDPDQAEKEFSRPAFDYKSEMD